MVGGWLVQDEVRFRAIKIKLFLMVVLTGVVGMVSYYIYVIQSLFGYPTTAQIR